MLVGVWSGNALAYQRWTYTYTEPINASQYSILVVDSSHSYIATHVEFYDTSWDSPLSEQGYFPNQNWSKDIQWWGAPRVEPGKRYLLFLQKPSMTDPPPNTYILVGAFMGKYEVSASGQLRYVGPAGEAKGLQEDASATKLDDLAKRLQR